MPHLKNLLFVALLLAWTSPGAQPRKFTVQGKSLYVYPLRSDNTDIPRYFGTLPDGDYVLFHEYSFKKKFLKKAYRLTDTTTINAIFSVRGNAPEGPAAFYDRNMQIYLSGKYVNGLREGEWKHHGSFVNVSHYEQGLLHGKYISYYASGKSVYEEGEYTRGQKSGTWKTWYPDGQLRTSFTLSDTTIYTHNVYNSMFPRRHTERSGEGYDDWYMNTIRSGNEKGALSRTEKIKFNKGQVAYFDTLYPSYAYKGYTGSPAYILVKENKELHDTASLFTLYNYSLKGHLEKKTVYRDGHILTSTGYRADGTVEDEYFYSEYYTLHKGDLYLKNVTYYYTRTVREYGLWMLHNNRDFKTEILSNGDTLRHFIIDDKDTINHSVTFRVLRYEPELKIRTVEYNRYVPVLTGSYDRGTAQQDSMRFYVNNKPFTGIYKPVYHRKRSRHRITKDKTGKSVLEYNRKKFNPDIPFGVYHYAEFVNGRLNGEVQTRESVRERSVYHMKNGERHGEYVSTVYNYPLRPYEKTIAGKNGIHSKKVTYIKVRKFYRYGKLDGTYESWYATGNKSDSTHYVKGEPEGESYNWFSNGNIQSLTTYHNGLLHGKSVKRYFDGTLKEEAHYKEGKLHGYLKKYKSGGEPAFTLYAQENYLDGAATLYNAIGLVEWKMDFDIHDSVPYLVEQPAKSSSRLLQLTWDGENIINQLQKKAIAYPLKAHYTEYFYTGHVAAEGDIAKGRMSGEWKFYDIDGNVIHTVIFGTEELELLHDTLFIYGRITSYYTNGNKRCEGYLLGFTRDYDCKSRKNVYDMEILYNNYWEMDGKQTLVAGNGLFTIYDEHGARKEQGEYFEHRKNGAWRTWDGNGKLNSFGHYENGLKEGIWWDGDLEGLNFIDNACFDTDRDEVVREIEKMKKNLNIWQGIWIHGKKISYEAFRINMNKEKEYSKYKFRGIVDF